MTHLDHLKTVVPHFGKVLDVGSGRGAFLRDCEAAGIEATGVECTKEYIELTSSLDVVNGCGENLPFPDNSFDFVNLAQVIEHVEDPCKVVKEIYRVLKPGGKAYFGVPTRYSFKDPHFKLYFVNWFPREWANGFISLFGQHKDYSIKNGRQRLAHSHPDALSCEVSHDMLPMHYFTFKQISELLTLNGFDTEDVRLRKVGALRPIYPILRDYFLDSFHLLAAKN